MFPTSFLSTLMHIIAENNVDQMMTIFVHVFSLQVGRFCIKIFQIFWPNIKPFKNHRVYGPILAKISETSMRFNSQVGKYEKK